jgi:integrase
MSIERRVRKKGAVYVVWWREGSRMRNRTFALKKDAEAFEATIRLAKRRGDLENLDAGKQSLEAFTEDWWRTYAEPRLERRTLVLYEGYLRNHILPYLGRLELRQLKPETVAKYPADLARAGVSPPTIRKSLVLLQGILERAVEWGRIPTNPARVVKKPSAAPIRLVTPLPPSTVEAIRATLLLRGRRRDASLVSVLAYAGLRPGEALALTWGDIRENTIIVDKRVTLGEVKVGAKSSARPRRTVRLLRSLSQDLAEWRLASGRPADQALVFPKQDGTPWEDHDFRNWRRRVYVPAAEAAGIEKPRPYDLRHSFCSLLLADGRSALFVASQMGHGLRMTLDTYGHLIEELEGQERIDAEAAIRAARERMLTQSSHTNTHTSKLT